MQNQSLDLNSSSPFAPSLLPSETLTFLNLPVPDLPPIPSLSLEHCLRCFNSLSPYDLSCDIERLPIGSVLSKFLHDVLPEVVKIENDGRETASVGFRNVSESGSAEKNGEDPHENSMPGTEVLQFETPELEIWLENPQLVHKEATDIFCQVSEIESTEDAIHLGLPQQFTLEAQETISLGGDSGSEHLIKLEDNVLEDGPAQGKLTFPFLEVDEMSLVVLSSMFIEDEVEKFLVDVESWQLTSKDTLVIDTGDNLGLREDHFLEYPCMQKQCLEYDQLSLGKLSEIDFLSLLDVPHQSLSSTSFLAPANKDCILPGFLPIFEDMQILEVDSPLLCDIFDSQKLLEPESCDHSSHEDVRLNRFQELIISQQLALVDHLFKSLHVPVLPDYIMVRPLYAIVEEVLMNLKTCPPSASDGIYLDWCLLEKEAYEASVSSSGQNMLEVMQFLSIDSDWDTAAAEKVMHDFIFSDHAPNKLSAEDCSEPLNILADGCSLLNTHLSGASSCELSNDKYRMPETERLTSECNSDRVSFLFKSMSPFDDLDFFLNPSNATAGKIGINTAEIHGGMFCKVQTSGPLAESSFTEHHSGPWVVILYPVKLSADIVSIAEGLKKSYLNLLEGDPRLRKAHKSLSEAADSFSLLKVPKQVFLDCIKNANSETLNLIQGDELVEAFATLCAIKQFAWYMCFYGLEPALSYIDKICQVSRLSILRHMVPHAGGTSQGSIVTSHPSLTIIQRILLSNSKGVKALVLAEHIFWQSMESLLTSMGLSFHELEIWEVSDCASVNLENLLDNDCLLASFEQISASFPFNKFGIILEYGGACHSSRISSLRPNLLHLPHLHFLKVELGELSSVALCEGMTMPLNSSIAMDANSLKPTDECMEMWNLERLLNFVPHKDEAFTLCNMTFYDKPSSVQLESSLGESDDYQTKEVSLSNRVIIVNTQNSNEVMIVSRRSTYQKILALEKDGIQVVERDSNLPVDIMLSTSACLVWYTCQNIGKKASGSSEGYSWLPCYIENIATNVLTIFSSAFSACVLIFEGDTGFLSIVMESSDGLYAAAASLGINLQLFYSYSPELTDEIILSCISTVPGLCTTLPESESLAESFLTRFPSINSLTANAILSSGMILIDFIEWSHEYRTSAVEKYDVPRESISLFSALCQYGELEDSRSIMTDCSSVSSGPDSKCCRKEIDLGRKGCYPENPLKVEVCMEDSPQFQNSKSSVDRTLPKVCKLRHSSIFEDVQIPADLKMPDCYFDKLHSEIGGMSVRSTAVPTDLKTFHTSGAVNNEKLDLFNNLDCLGCLEWTDEKCSNVTLQKSGGEAICHSDRAVSGCRKFPSFMPEMGTAGMKSSLQNELSFGEIKCPAFHTEGAVQFTSSLQNDGKDWHILPGLRGEFVFREPNHDDLPINNHHKRDYTLDTKGTPLRSAVSSLHPHKGSPWTVEFLNKIREKSNLRQRFLPIEASPRCDMARNLSNLRKRRSPSILEFFKYRGGSTVTRAAEHKRQKKSAQSAGSAESRKMPASFVSSWTPIDKRSRRVLSFVTDETGSQTKLVWRDNCRYPPAGNFRNDSLVELVNQSSDCFQTSTR